MHNLGDERFEVLPLFLASAVDNFGTGMMRSLLPEMARARGWGAVGLGGLESLYGVGQLLGALCLGRASDRLGRVRVLRFCLLGSAGGYLLLLPPRPLLLASRLALGLCKHVALVARAVLCDTRQGARRSAGMAWLTAAGSFGYAIGPATGGLLSQRLWWSAPICLELLGLAAALLASARLRETVAAEPRGRSICAETGLEPSRRSWSDGGMLRTLVPVVFAEVAFTAWTSTVLPVLLARPGAPSLGVFQSVVALGVVASSSLLLPRLCRRAGDATLVAAGNLSFAAAVLLCTWLPWVSAPLLSFGISCFRGLSPALLARHASASTLGAAMGHLDATGAACRILAPVAVGAVIQSFDLRAALLCLALLLLAAAALLVPRHQPLSWCREYT